MIRAKLQPPPGFVPGDNPAGRAEFTLTHTHELGLSGAAAFARAAFLKQYHLVQGVLSALREVWCTCSITVRVSHRSVRFEGHVTAWDPGSYAGVAALLEEMADCAWALSRHAESSAEFVCRVDRDWEASSDTSPVSGMTRQ